jgi:uncharacterized protein YhaN
VLPRLQALAERCRSDAAARERLPEAQEERDAAGRALAEAEAAARAAAAARTALLADLGGDAAAARARIAAERQASAHAAERRQLEGLIAAHLGGDDGAAADREELVRGEVAAWSTAADAAEAAEADARRAHEGAVRAHRDAETARAALERSADVARLETEAAGVRAELARAAAEWRTHAAARALIRDTLTDYQRDRQPEVLREAGRLFCGITGGRFETLVQDDDGRDVLARTADGGTLDAAALSRGTAEQLYLCLRLALAAEFGRRAVPLPILLDDVLVNFDPARARAAAAALLDVARHHQLLLFTCHPATAALVTALEPATPVLALEPGAAALAAAAAASPTPPAVAPPAAG